MVKNLNKKIKSLILVILIIVTGSFFCYFLKIQWSKNRTTNCNSNIIKYGYSSSLSENNNTINNQLITKKEKKGKGKRSQEIVRGMEPDREKFEYDDTPRIDTTTQTPLIATYFDKNKKPEYVTKANLAKYFSLESKSVGSSEEFKLKSKEKTAEDLATFNKELKSYSASLNTLDSFEEAKKEIIKSKTLLEEVPIELSDKIFFVTLKSYIESRIKKKLILNKFSFSKIQASLKNRTGLDFALGWDIRNKCVTLGISKSSMVKLFENRLIKNGGVFFGIDSGVKFNINKNEFSQNPNYSISDRKSISMQFFIGFGFHFM